MLYRASASFKTAIDLCKLSLGNLAKEMTGLVGRSRRKEEVRTFPDHSAWYSNCKTPLR